MLAVHANERIITLELSDTGTLKAVGEIAIAPPRTGTGGAVSGAHGPQLSLAWSTDGSHIIAATNDRQAEFGVIEVSDAGKRLEYRRSLTACGFGQNYPNDIWTANGLITPTATKTSDLPPTSPPTPTATASATAHQTDMPATTATPTTTANSRPSFTDNPRPIYLPIALFERCDPTQERIDVALVIDASTSMNELTRAGRPKIDAALEASRAFLDLLDLTPNAGDQAAIVAFNSDAWILAPLTSDHDTLDRALDEVVLAQQTRLDRAIAVGAEALMDATRRREGNQPVLVLLTDGRANPVPIDAAVAEAERAKAVGVSLFAIGLGDDLDADGLSRIASRAQYFLRAPDAEDLVELYREVARSIPCAATTWWPAREAVQWHGHPILLACCWTRRFATPTIARVALYAVWA